MIEGIKKNIVNGKNMSRWKNAIVNSIGKWLFTSPYKTLINTLIEIGNSAWLIQIGNPEKKSIRNIVLLFSAYWSETSTIMELFCENS